MVFCALLRGGGGAGAFAADIGYMGFWRCSFGARWWWSDETEQIRQHAINVSAVVARVLVCMDLTQDDIGDEAVRFAGWTGFSTASRRRSNLKYQIVIDEGIVSLREMQPKHNRCKYVPGSMER